MNHAANGSCLCVNGVCIEGICVYGRTVEECEASQRSFLNRLEQLKLDGCVETSIRSTGSQPCVEFRLREEFAHEWAPGGDTTQLCERLQLDTVNNSADLEREILLAMLVSPIPFEFPSDAELMAAVRMRQRIVEAARKTALSFATSSAERPVEDWDYDEDRGGFLIRPDRLLVDALRKATQPDSSGTLYSFSCYRATEYVIALAIAEEAEAGNPELLAQLQRQAEHRAVRSGEFHRVFCREHGSRTEPLPLRYFVPGDRTWFRNPDCHSSDASGYEGSWVFYLGNCRFSNFWKRGREFTLTTKCLEMFHWRHATFRDAEGDLRINETIVEERVNASLQNPSEVTLILGQMERLYDPAGVYADGGCIDISRESPRWVCPGTTDLILPDVVGSHHDNFALTELTCL